MSRSDMEMYLASSIENGTCLAQLGDEILLTDENCNDHSPACVVQVKELENYRAELSFSNGSMGVSLENVLGTILMRRVEEPKIETLYNSCFILSVNGAVVTESTISSFAATLVAWNRNPVGKLVMVVKSCSQRRSSDTVQPQLLASSNPQGERNLSGEHRSSGAMLMKREVGETGMSVEDCGIVTPSPEAHLESPSITAAKSSNAAIPSQMTAGGMFSSRMSGIEAEFRQMLDRIRPNIISEVPNEVIIHFINVCDWNPMEAMNCINGIIEDVRGAIKKSEVKEKSLNDQEMLDDVDQMPEIAFSLSPDPFPRFKPSSLSSSSSSSQLSPTNKPISDNFSINYEAVVSSRHLGITVENVLERTVVRSIQDNSDASKAKIERGSLLIQIGDRSTSDLSHAETLELLKHAARPLRLKFRRLDAINLERRRSEMRALIHSHNSTTNTDAEAAMSMLELLEDRVVAVLRTILVATCVLTRIGDDSINGTNTSSSLFSVRDHRLAVRRVLDLVVRAEDAMNDPPDLRTTMSPYQSDVLSDVPVFSSTAIGQKSKAGGTSSSPSLLSQQQQKNDDGGNKIGLLQSLLPIFGKSTKTDSSNNGKPSDDVSVIPTILESPQYSPLSSRLAVIGNILDELSDVVDWKSTIGEAVERDLRDLVCMVVQLDSETIFRPDSKQGQPHKIIEELLTSLESSKIASQAIPLLCRLFSSTSVSSKLACLQLIPCVYFELALLKQLQLRGLVNRAATDTNAFIRSVALNVADKLIGKIETSAIPWLLMLCDMGSGDEDWAVRVEALRIAVHFVTRPPTSLLSLNEQQSYVTGIPHLMDGDHSVSIRTVQDDVYDVSRQVDPEVTVISKEGFIKEMHLINCRVIPVITRLAEDTMPEVRRALLASSSELCLAMGDHWASVIVDTVTLRCQDDDESVRCAALTCIPKLAMSLLRLAVSPRKPQLSRSFQEGDGLDPEKKIRAAFSRILDSLLPSAAKLYDDAAVDVRVCLSTALADLLGIVCGEASVSSDLGKTMVTKISSRLVPVIMQLLLDPSPLVSNAMLTRLAPVSGAEHASWMTLLFLPAHVTRMMVALDRLARSKKWRTRQAVSCLVPLLAAASHTVEDRERVGNLVVPLLRDEVFQVRKTSSYCLCRAASSDFVDASIMADARGEPVMDMGRMWLDCIILPQVEMLRTSPCYQDRVIALHMIGTLFHGDLVRDDVRMELLYNIALTLSDDKVANVQISFCHMMLNVPLSCIRDGLKPGSLLGARFLQKMDALTHAADKDVLYLSQQVLSRVSIDKSNSKNE